jgi:transglutaminase-like putative cysteine protease
MTTTQVPRAVAFARLLLRIRAAAAAAVAVAIVTLAPGHGQAAPVAAGPAWDGEPFSRTAAELAALARDVAAPPNAAAVVLLEEGRFQYDDAGRLTYRYWRVTKVLTSEGASNWGHVSASWAPWHQDRPELRARVLGADGAFHELDPATIDRAPAPPESEHTYSDWRVLRAPLPAVAPGAVIEQSLVVRDTQPFFAAGTTSSFVFGASVPVQKTRVIVEASRGAPVQFAEHLLPGLSRAQTRTRAGTRWVFESGPLPPLADAESSLPADVPRYPHLRFATGRSWQAVASAYGALIDQQIATGAVAGAAADLGDARDHRAIAERLLERLHDRVRYTGLELGESSIVPWTPAETWSRRFGDCKDKATLLVALLRQAGVPAHVALLRAGTDQDLDEGLPGLGSFNHAIVVLPGDEPIWIDPTSELARVGELPWGDQGRLALIASPHAKRLVRTPVAASSANRVVEKRELTLAETGPARVVETTELYGIYEQNYRSDYRGAEPSKLRELLTNYVKNEYVADRLIDYGHSDPRDLAAPFSLRIEVGEAERGVTAAADAVAYLFRSDLLELLPDAITPEKSASDAPTRQHDFVLVPHVYEIRHRIVMPPGYRPRALPDDERIALGPAVLQTSFREEGGAVLATLRFDTVKSRLTPVELREMGERVVELRDAEAIKIMFDHTAAADLAAGRTRQAVAEYRRLAELHPGEALHRAQIALALLAVGMGEAARAEAARAIALEPAAAHGYEALGWILQHDRMGRRFGLGFDHAGAVGAYRRAIERAPKGVDARANLAILFEHDTRGRRYQGDLVAAIAEYHAIREELDDHTYDDNLLWALFHGDRFAELEKLAVSMPVAATRNGLLVAAVAAERGSNAAERAARKVGGTAEQRAAFANAGSWLLQRRRYALAADLLERGAAGAADGAEQRQRAVLVRGLRPQSLTPAVTEPGQVVMRLVQLVVLDEIESVVELFGGDAGDLHDEELAEVRAALALQGIDLEDVTRPFMVDWITAFLDMRVDGTAATGWRVTARPALPGLSAPAPPVADSLYLAQERDRVLIVANDRDPSSLGRRAFQLLAQGEAEAAITWLDWAGEHAARAPTGPATAFLALWEAPRPGAERTVARARLAAAALMGTSRFTAKPAIHVLEACARDATAIGDACSLAHVHALLAARRFAAALEGVTRLVDRRIVPQEQAEAMRADALIGLGDWRALDDLARAHLAEHPDDALATTLLARAALGQGKMARAHALYAAVAQGESNAHSAMGESAAQAASMQAWIALFLGATGDAELAAANKAVLVTGRKRHECLNTLAAVHAVRGELDDAYRTLVESMAVAAVREPRSQDWLVFGRIAAGYGLRDTALAAYRQARKGGAGADEIAGLTIGQLAARWQREVEMR